jgi:hypothetical protein
MLAGRRTGSDSMFLHRRWLQKLSIKVPVLNVNLVALACRMGTRTTEGQLRGMQCKVLRYPIMEHNSGVST